MFVLVVESMDDEGESGKVFCVVIHQAQSENIVHAEFSELEPREQVACFLVFFLRHGRMLCVVVRHIVGKARAERCAEEEIFGEHPVIGITKVDVVVVVNHRVEKKRFVDVRA